MAAETVTVHASVQENASAAPVSIVIRHWRHVPELWLERREPRYELALDGATCTFLLAPGTPGETLPERWVRVANVARQHVARWLGARVRAPRASYTVTEIVEVEGARHVTWHETKFDRVLDTPVPVPEGVPTHYLQPLALAPDA